MDKPMNSLIFMAMRAIMTVRDLFISPHEVVAEADLEPGMHVLDYGCGPGSLTIATSRMVGPSGRVYALDIHPLALKTVMKKAGKERLANIQPILSDRPTGLPDKTMDTVLLYDIFHMLGDPDGVIKELHRVMKDDALLSMSDHHMKEHDIINGLTAGGLFILAKKNRRTYSFVKACTGARQAQ